MTERANRLDGHSGYTAVHGARYFFAWRWGALASVLMLLSGCTESVELSLPPAVLAEQAADVGAGIESGVFYVTNRLREAQGTSVDDFTGERGGLEVGRCEATFTPIRGLIELASRVPFHIPSERKQMQVRSEASGDVFWSAVESSVAQSTSQSLVLFVHGYSNSFERTCLMAAELQRLLGNQATVMMFSWPSNGRPTDYVADQADLEWSVPQLSELLSDLGERFGHENIQLLAHSLGSRGSIFALQRLAADRDERPLLRRLVFLAPDFDAQTFVELFPRLRPLAGSVGLYASSSDTPLRVSEELNGHPRLGQAGDSLTVVPGMETIDISPAGLYQILGHEYFYYHPQVAADLVLQVGSGLPAAGRPGLDPRTRAGYPYWALIAEPEKAPQ